MSSPNEILGGAPVIYDHAHEHGRHGFSGTIKLLLQDAGVQYTYHPVNGPDWPALKAEFTASGHSPGGCMPVMQIGDRWFSQSPAMVMWLSSKLGYGPTNPEETYKAVAISDVGHDMAYGYYSAVISKEEGAMDKFYTTTVFGYLKALDTWIASSPGPFALGDRITFADFMTVTMVMETMVQAPKAQANLLAGFPTLKRTVDAVLARPNVAGSDWVKVYESA